ncbi:MAG: hypothetical protein K2G99_04870, partial [Desulfovibrio sp.]|nr:hypothetical protein [Desulfovibrio sp.]
MDKTPKTPGNDPRKGAPQGPNEALVNALGQVLGQPLDEGKGSAGQPGAQALGRMAAKGQGAPAGGAPGPGQTGAHAPNEPAGQAPAPEDGGWRGFFAEAWAFVRAIFVRSENEQTPDKPLSEMAKSALGTSLGKGAPTGPGAAPGASGQGLFAAMDAPLNGLTPDDIHYADEVVPAG